MSKCAQCNQGAGLVPVEPSKLSNVADSLLYGERFYSKEKRVLRRGVMRKHAIVGCILVLCLALGFGASTTLGQAVYGSIIGTVTDPQGAVVAGAKVTVHNVDTGLERTTQTSADGSYSLPELPIGTYTVTVTQSGFQTAVTSNVAVNVAAERRVDVVFRTGQVSEKVEVSGSGLLSSGGVGFPRRSVGRYSSSDFLPADA